MYTLGTASLVEAVRRAIAAEPDLLVQMERTIDLHLANARGMGRIIYVLGGEAQRLESPLYARRMEVHDLIVQLFRDANRDRSSIDPLLVRTLIIALEQIVRAVLDRGDQGRRVTETMIARARAVMMRVATGTIAGEGPGVAPMPMFDEK
jgi:hypothetical protein